MCFELKNTIMNIGEKNMNNNEDFNVTIERIKELKGSDSQEIFAKKINLTQSNVSKMLGGMPPSASTLIAIAKEYDVSVDWLLGLSDRKSRNNFPDLDNITYADALAVFDRLIEYDSLFTNSTDPSKFHSFDYILNYLLESRITVGNVDINTRRYWYETTAEQFSEFKIMKWSEILKKIYVDNVPKKPETAYIIDFLKRYDSHSK